MKTEQLHMRISPELKEQLQKLADADNRSISNYLELLIRKEVEKKEG